MYDPSTLPHSHLSLLITLVTEVHLWDSEDSFMHRLKFLLIQDHFHNSDELVDWEKMLSYYNGSIATGCEM